MQLQKKGSQVLKRDRPIFLLASNHSLRQIVKKKIQFSCACDHTLLPDDILCAGSSLCRPNEDAESLYLALRARLHVIHLDKPLFPRGDLLPDL